MKQCVALAVFLCAGSAVSAQFSAAAGVRPGSGHGSTVRVDEYQVDDGSYEDGIGLTAGGGIAFANGYTSVAGRDLITSVRIAFGVPGTLNGAPVTAYLWSDPNGDGSPADAQVLASAAGVISGAVEIGNLPNMNPTFVDFNIPDTVVPIGQKFFVGYVMQNQAAGQYPGAIDLTGNAGVSYIGYVVGGTFDPGAWTNTASTGDIGFPGNWTLRANATGSNPNAVGACCFSNGTCSFITIANCTSQGGNFAGENVTCAQANCPAPGACCFFSGSCSLLLPAACTAQGGVFTAGNCQTVTCTPQGWQETGDAGDLPGTAQITTGPSTTAALNQIRGNIGTGDSDMYQIRICSPGSFSATTVGGTTIDTQLFLFNASGGGLAFNDDAPAGTLQSALSNAFTSSLPAGLFNLAVSTFDRDPTAGGLEMWIDTPYNIERAPDGPGAAGVVNAWAGSGSSGNYTVFLTGSCYAAGGSTCYANCDNSTQAPVLNVADFTCFLQRFAAGCP